jgi:hypothetical protein
LKQTSRLTAIATALALCLAAATSARADPNSMSGFWQLVSKKMPEQPALKEKSTARPAGDPRTVSNADPMELRWCVPQGVPYVMDNAGPLDIIVSPREVVILAEKIALPRHIYTASPSRPDMSVFDPSPVGYSSGKWNNGKLEVETVGLSNGVGPLGIARTQTSRVVERFEVAGDTLTVNVEWRDPAVLSKPLRYTLAYRRLPKTYTAAEHYCDPRENGVGYRK